MPKRATPQAARPAELPDPAELTRLQTNLAEIFGESNLRSLETNWLEKMLNGAIVRLSIGRMGCHAHLTDQDLGIAHRKQQQKERRQAWYDLGNALLLPRRYATALDSKESNARKKTKIVRVFRNFARWLIIGVHLRGAIVELHSCSIKSGILLFA